MTTGARVDLVLLGLVRDPRTHLLRRWHWKAAVVSSATRGGIFFLANVPAGADAGVRAMVTELLFRAVASGIFGTVTQSLRHATPPWAATLTALVLMPGLGHSAEYVVHSLAGTPRLGASMAASIVFTCVTTLFNLFIMRQGVLVVGEGRQSFVDDLRAMPRLMFAFLRAGVRMVGGSHETAPGRGTENGAL